MKIRFLQDTHIRLSPDTNMEPIGYIFEGTEVEVESQEVVGKNVRGNNRWYRDAYKQWYYWSGETEVIAKPEEPVVAPVLTGPPGGYPVYPVFDSMTSMTNSENIPKDETRIVPPFETLQMIEEGFQNALIELQNVVVSSSKKDKTGLDEELPTAAPSGSSDLEIEEVKSEQHFVSVSKPSPWELPVGRQKLNWGIRKYSLDQDWWGLSKITGKGVRVALLSTGATKEHPDLPNISNSFLYEDASQLDTHGLGSQSAVICAGTGQNIYGVAPEAELLIGKIGEQDYAIHPAALIAGMDWAIEENVDIIAMLVDFPSLKAAEINMLEALIKRAKEKDIFMLAPVGNSNNKKPESRYPARLEGVFSVGGHSELGERCSFSAKSYDLDLLSPGEGLLTSGADNNVIKNTKSVAIATAFTAGFAALVHQKLQQLGHTKKAATIEKILVDTAAKRQNINVAKNIEYGYGLLNPIAVLQKLESLA
ncbi:MAG: S8 family serine peptidase [Chitinophagales bacterium]|nr:S8 family serine peptidase [Chitinophagales bacterium]